MASSRNTLPFCILYVTDVWGRLIKLFYIWLLMKIVYCLGGSAEVASFFPLFFKVLLLSSIKFFVVVVSFYS
jgi:hypothetical protein